MSDNFNSEEFEKVDADQDEIVTSTSMTGEEAEEDRYSGNPAQGEGDLLGDFTGVPPSAPPSNEAFENENLLSFGTDTTPTEPSNDYFQPEKTKTVIPEQVSESKTTAPAEGLMGIPGAKALSGWMKTVDPRVLDLIYWRDVKKTGVVFGSMMFILLSLTFFTILSVLAYLSLAILTVTLSFRVYKNVMQAVQKTNDGHPFKKLLDLDISLQSEVVESAADKIACNVNNCSKELRRLFLVEDYVDSLKFGLLLWLLTYVGSWFNGMTLIILAVVSIFTLPKVYETYQGPIDQNVNMVRGQLNNIMKQVSSKIPFPKKKAKTQ